ncbi:hypothetical protein MXD63_11065 [Frankia sp. Cpl3]|nr:hypothetical protein [Frankia sp. Cpl3]
MIDSIVLAPVFGLVAVFFLVETVRGRSFRSRATRSTSLGRTLLFSGLTLLQIEPFPQDHNWVSIAFFAMGLACIAGALCVWTWQGWSGTPRQASDPTATQERPPLPAGK